MIGHETSGTPRGTDLLKTLIDLFAEQHGVKITYEIKECQDSHSVAATV